MAEGKKSFVLYSDMLQSIEHLTNEEKGILFNHLLEYVNDLNPILNDRLILTAWKPIELSLKRDLVKFEEVKTKRSDAGKRSAKLRALKLQEQNSTNSTSVESAEQVSTNPTDSVNVIVSDINKKLLSEIEISNVDVSLLHYAKTAKEFQRLFIQNLKEKGASSKHQENAKFGAYVTPIRLIIENNEGTIQDLRDIFSYLSGIEGEFWKTNILSTESLRKQLPKLLMNARAIKVKKPIKEDRL